jgi:PadR family transcriptional regulator PadR
MNMETVPEVLGPKRRGDVRPERTYQTGKHLEAFLLLLLAEEPNHGGALLTRLHALLPSQWSIDDGQVYRLLRALESHGAVTSTWEPQANGAPRRVYRLTSAGFERLAEWKDDIQLRRASLNVFLRRWRALSKRLPTERSD